MAPKTSTFNSLQAQELVEQLLDLFQARAVAAWNIDSRAGGQLLSAEYDSGRHAALFRQSLSRPQLDQLPKKPSFTNPQDDAELLTALTLKSTTVKNALVLPLRQSSRLIGLMVIVNLPQPPASQLINYASKVLTQQWLLMQQLDQQQRQLQEMTDQSRQWQSIYTGVQESIVLLDLKGKILSLNPATEHVTGRSAPDMIGKHIGELFPKVGPLGSGIHYLGPSGLYQTLEERRPSDLFEAIVETKDKRHIWVNYTYTPLWDGNGHMLGLVRVTSDVSNIKTVEQMKNDFVSIASHELRTPLGVISGYLNLFLGGQLGDLTQDQQTFLERIYHSAADMSALVEDLLNISRIEAGRLEVSVQSFNLDQLIAEVMNHLELRSQAKSIHIQVKHSATVITLRADRQKIEQALTNILDNAIKYTYDKGTIAVNIKLKDDVAEVVVKDSGVGINPEHIGHIFEKFYRESNPLSVKEGGSGLGLYISRKLIELHGGTISVASKPGHGSAFTIKLPLSTKKHLT